MERVLLQRDKRGERERVTAQRKEWRNTFLDGGEEVDQVIVTSQRKEKLRAARFLLAPFSFTVEVREIGRAHV